MPSQMNFQALNFGNISQHEAEARRRYYESIANGFRSVGEGAKDISESYMSEEERKKREAEDKKKWDNMIAQQEYQKEQDRINREYRDTRDNIADTRYDNEYGLKLDEIRKNEEKLKKENEALERFREGLKKSYTPEFLAKYGPTAQADYEAAMTAPTLAEAVASGRNLGQGIYQKELMDFQREQNAANEKRTFAEERPNKITRSTLSNLTDKRIDISSGYLPTSKKEAERWLAEINAAIMAQNSITQDGVSEHSDFSSKVTSSLYSLQRRLQEFLGQTPNGY